MEAKMSKSAFKILLVGLAIGLLAACNQASYKEDLVIANADVTEEFEAVQAEKPVEETKEFVPGNLKILKFGNVRYKVSDVQKATYEIKGMAYQYNAYISDLRFEDNLHRKENRFTIKVPAKHFDQLLDSIGSVAEFIDYENITTQDVTEEYLDLQTRLKTKQEVKSRLEEILRKNAKTVDDILATEDRIRILQEEIESVQGRLNYLTSKVAYSSIQVDLYQEVDYKEEPTVYKKTFWDKTKESLSFGWDFLEGLVLLLLHIWPLIIIGFFVFFGIKKKRFGKK